LQQAGPGPQEEVGEGHHRHGRPSLPDDLSASVRLHFIDLTGWLAQLLALGVRQGGVSLARSPAEEADAFMSAVHGAMLAARAFGDPWRFATITETLLSRIVRLH
jgi:TetR/AcrR family transcriptional repressor of nem operon